VEPELVDKGIINMPAAKEVFEVLFKEGGDPRRIVDEKGISQVNDMEVIKQLVEQAIAENPESVNDYRNGKKAAVKFIIGQVMRLSKGKANPLMVTELLEKKLTDMK
jgi:aspartyl-tRNA(Asn)/glutamyl-tRNA(Gln) amidotransferase subunit B